MRKKKHTIYPPGKYIFNAFNKTPFNDVKVIILGQDPYHGPGQAHGLSFSVPSGIKTPPSLVNIFKEISEDLNLPTPSHGNLESWAAQGVLLLNSTLTVRANLAGSHQRKGWENFTDAIIKRLSDRRENLVFLLWGRFSQNKSVLIDEKKHLILQAPHPSPLSAYTGFFGCRHFSKTNEFLLKKEKDAIDWTLPN
jgi:uracil-DNA glycosylase